MAEGSQSFDDELSGLFDHSQDAFCIAGFDGYLRRANPALPRSLGYTLEELLASPFVDNIYPGDREAVEAVLAEVANGRPVVGFECRHVRADGAVRWFEWSTSSRPEAGVMYGVARDVTERRLASDELSALRRVAMVAAEGAAPSDLFAVVAEEVARVMDVPVVTVVRYEPDAKATEHLDDGRAQPRCGTGSEGFGHEPAQPSMVLTVETQEVFGGPVPERPRSDPLGSQAEPLRRAKAVVAQRAVYQFIGEDLQSMWSHRNRGPALRLADAAVRILGVACGRVTDDRQI
jgi:PAS domain S-box-containing protein